MNRILNHIVLIGLCVCFASSIAFGSVVHLSSGDSLSGKIQGMDEQTLYLESDRGFGVLKISRRDIRSVEFDAVPRNLSRKLGIGVYTRPATNEERVSLKNWLNPTTAAELLIGYNRANNRTDFSLEGRYTQILLSQGNNDMFWGGGIGFLNYDGEKGTSIRVFSGTEIFPVSYPNIGFSLELGFSTTQGLSATNQGFYNALSARYYF